MKKYTPTIVFLVVAFVIVVGITFALKSSSVDLAQYEAPTQSATSTKPLLSYTLAQVATHNSAQSCWTAINGGVYDVTAWVSQHPGGAQAILSLCGTDGSSAFNGQHGGERRPAQELAGFKIGTLIQ